MDPEFLNDLLAYTLKLQVVTDFPFNQYGCSLLIPFGIPQKVVFKTLREIHFRQPVFLRDRKSTRLNSSHVSISYAVFCLKKKKQMQDTSDHSIQRFDDN